MSNIDEMEFRLALFKEAEQCFDPSRLNHFLEDCIHGGSPLHDVCRRYTRRSGCSAKRLLDLGEPGVYPFSIRLMLLDPKEPKCFRYVALSHSWGTLSFAEQDLMSTSLDNEAARYNSVDLLTLPNKYQAAILLCRCLQARYLWIDSLCIVQVIYFLGNRFVIDPPTDIVRELAVIGMRNPSI
jgi:hypothetical protein